MGSFGHSFLEGSVPQQRVVDGLVFPKVLFPATVDQAHDVSAVVQAIQQDKAWLIDQLHEHGAILFRGFAMRSSADFNDFVEAFGWESMDYIGVAPRTKLQKKVYTANESSLDTEIYFHHEMSYSPFFPSKVMFFCEVESAEGAATPLVVSRKVTETVEKRYPEFMKKLQENGITYTIPMKSREDFSSFLLGWQDFFGTTDQAEAEKRAVSYRARIEWGANKSATIIQGPVPAVTTYTEHPGKRVWRNILTGIYQPPNVKGKGGVCFGDGSPLPEEAVDGCKAILEEHAVDIPWCTGDVFLLDNLAVMHGRRVGKAPRKILASLVPYDS